VLLLLSPYSHFYCYSHISHSRILCMYTLYRPIGTQTDKENRDSSVPLYYRFQINSSVALSIGSARQEIMYDRFILRIEKS